MKDRQTTSTNPGGYLAACQRPPRWLLAWWALFFGLAVVAAAGLLKLGWSEHSHEQVQERLEAGKEPNAHHAARVYTWYAGWINVGGLLLLAAAGPWLARPSTGLQADRTVPDPASGDGDGVIGGARGRPGEARARRAFLLVVGGTMVMSGVLNSSRLDFSLWGDEDFTARRVVTGVPVKGEDGAWQVEQPAWSKTLWDLAGMNNHVLFSVLSRLSHEWFGPDPEAATGPRDPWFSEAVVRLPSFLAGLLALPAMALCLRMWGVGRVAAAAAVLMLALHPWHVRHGVDARGYALALLWTPLLLAAIRGALNRATWPRWLAVGGLSLLMFHSYLATVYLLVPIHGSLLVYWLVRVIRERRLPTGAARWATGMALAAILGLQLVSPMLPAIGLVTANPLFHGQTGWLWWQDAAGFLVAGTPWNLQVANHPQPTALEFLWGESPILTGLAGLLVVALALTGLWVLFRRMVSRGLWLLLAAVVGGPLLLGIHMWLGGVKPYHWYLSIFLPGWILALGLGLDWLWRRWLPVPVLRATVVLALLAMFWLGNDKALQLRHYPFEPVRDSVALARAVTNPLHPGYNRDEMTASFVMYSLLYDPGTIVVRNAQELREVMRQAELSGRTLTVNHGSPGLARSLAPEIMELLEDPRLFEKRAFLPGHLNYTCREVWRYRSGSVELALPIFALRPDRR